MGQLPFLVVHGRAISIALVAGGGALGVAAMQLVRRAREVARLARERDARKAELRALSPGRATIQGRLRGRAASAFAEAGMVVRERSEDLAIDVDGVRVELRGDVEVVAGACAKASARVLPRGFVSKAERGAWRAYELRDGDEVIARGQLTNVAAATGSYREAAGVWVMAPLTETPVVELFASKPAARASAITPGALASVGVVCTAVSYLVLWGAGTQLVARHSTVAAALPHVRDAALDTLAYELEHHAPRTDDTLDQRLELAELQHGCAARARMEGQEQRFEAELVDGNACGDLVAAIDGFAHVGDYKHANELDARRHGVGPRDGTIALAAGDWSGAALAADQQRSLLHDPRLRPVRTQRESERLECYAAWFRAKAGDTNAAARLATVAPTNLDCRLARAMLLPAAQRQVAFAQVAALVDPDQPGAIRNAEMLTWVYSADPAITGPDLYSTTMMMVGESRSGDPVWLAPLAAQTHSPGGSARTEVQAYLAALDAIRGDFPSAMQEIRAAEQQARTEQLDELEGLRRAIALHLPDEIAPDARASSPPLGTQHLVELRAGHPPNSLEMIAEQDPSGLTAALAAAASGDALALAHGLALDRPSWFDSGSLLAVLPRVHDHRAELAAALRHFPDASEIESDRLPFSLLAEGAMQRDLARLAGDEVSARRWQHLIEGQLPVLDDPDRVIALLLWQGD